jgi:predicted metal-binding membrane protein
MTVTGAALGRPPQPAARPWRTAARRLLLRRPELPAAAVVTAAWLALLAGAARHAAGGGPAAGMAGMPGMGAAHRAAGGPWAAAAGGLPGWVLMTAAMMGPAALAGIRHTGLNSLRWRRGRAMAGFAAAYLAVWTAFGVLALAAAALPGVPVPGPAALAVVLAAAAGWQLCPAKRRCLRACHRSVPLPPSGWRAECGSLRFGLRNGAACLGSCWCLMLVMVAAPAGQLLWTVGLAGAVTAERLAPRPRAVTRFTGVACAFAAVAVLATANLLR